MRTQTSGGRYSVVVSKDALAVGLMGFAVLGWSCVPLVVAMGAGEGLSPFKFNAFYKLGMAIGCVLALLALYRVLLFDRAVWRVFFRRLLSRNMFLWMLAFLDLGFFAWSTRYVNISVTTVLFEVWPVVMVVMTAWLFRFDKRYRIVNGRTVFLFGIAFLGVGSVVYSQAGSAIFPIGESGVEFGVGVLLVVIAVMSRSLSAFGFRWSADFGAEISEGSGIDRGRCEMFGVVVGMLACCLVNFVLSLVVGVIDLEPMDGGGAMVGLAGGIVLGGFAAVAWRKANLVTDNLSYNVMVYFTPVVALVLLYAFGLVVDVDLAFLVFGAFAVVIGNIGVYLQIDLESDVKEPDDELGFEDFVSLVEEGESEIVEFKPALMTNLKDRRRDKRIEAVLVKSVAGFLNARGGVLFVGVDDSGRSIGLREVRMGGGSDRFSSEDKMSLHLRDMVVKAMGAAAMSDVRVRYFELEGAVVMAVVCGRSASPVYIRERDRSRFFVRVGSSTTSLSAEEAVGYVRTHWG